jgi:hypothetical protein
MRAAVAQKRPSPRGASAIEVVAETLENYARRGVFRGFSRDPSRTAERLQNGVAPGSRFDLILD